MSTVDHTGRAATLGATPRAALPRLDGPDLARGLALIMMALAHTAPSDGPARILMTTEFLTAPLFALLVGAGAQLARDRRRDGIPATLVRASALILCGWLLAQSAAQIVIVLVPLGVLTVLCLGLVRLPSGALGAVSALGITATPLLTTAHAHLVTASVSVAAPSGGGAAPLTSLVGLLGGAGPYRMSAFLAYAAVGVLLVRWFRRSSPSAVSMSVPATVLLVLMLGLLVVPNLVGIGVHAYSGTLLETAGNLAGAAGILLTCLAVDAGQTSHLPPRVRGAIRAPGAMSLSIYILQTLVLHTFSVLNPEQRDDSWTMVTALVVLSIAVALGWYAVLGERAARGGNPFSRGPLEGCVGVVSSAVDRLLGSALRHSRPVEWRSKGSAGR